MNHHRSHINAPLVLEGEDHPMLYFRYSFIDEFSEVLMYAYPM